MDTRNTSSEEQVTRLVEQLLTEIRQGKTVDLETWNRRLQETDVELPALIATAQALDSALNDCRATAAELAQSADWQETPLPDKIARYEVRGLIGSGGMGKVYMVYDPSLDRIAAMKMPRLDVPAGANTLVVQRFVREMRAAARVQHANICPIHDVGEHQGAPYVVMGYIKGRSLADMLDQNWDPLAAVRLVMKIGCALEAVHAEGLVHRDVKPGNILVDEHGEPFLADFGLARPVAQGDHLTNPGMLVGTPAFMAPEQVAGNAAEIGPATDVYCLGMVLYRMLTGQLPFDNSRAGMSDRLTKQPPAPLDLRPDLDVSLSAIILRALACSPEARYPSAHAFVSALESWCEADVDLVEPSRTPALSSEDIAGQITASRSVVLSGLPGVEPVTVQIPTSAKEVKVRMAGEKGRKRGRRFVLSVTFTMAALLIAVGIWFFIFSQNSAARRDAIIIRMAECLRADPPAFDKAWEERQSAKNLPSQMKNEVEQEFDVISQARIDEIAKGKGGLKAAALQAKALAKLAPEHPSLGGIKDKWLKAIRKHVDAGDAAALDDLESFQVILSDEKLKDPFLAVSRISAEIAGAKDANGCSAVAESLGKLPVGIQRLQKAFYERLFEQCLNHHQYQVIFATVKEQGSFWQPAGEPYRTKAYDGLLARLGTASYDDLAGLGVNEIYTKHLSSEQEKTAVRKELQAVYRRHMQKSFDEIGDNYERDPRGSRDLIEKLERLPDEFFASYKQKFDPGLDEQRTYWKCLAELDKTLELKTAKPTAGEAKSLVTRYLSLVNAKAGTVTRGLDGHTNRLIDLAEKYPNEFGAGLMENKKRIVERSKAIQLRQATEERVAKLDVKGAARAAVLIALDNAKALYDENKFKECRGVLEAIKENDKDLTDSGKTNLKALLGLVKARTAESDKDKAAAAVELVALLSRDAASPGENHRAIWQVLARNESVKPTLAAPRVADVLGVWKQLPEGTKKDVDADFKAVTGKFFEHHLLEGPAAGAGNKEWKECLDLCARIPEQNALVLACMVESLLELQDKKGETALGQFKAAITNEKMLGAKQAGRALSVYFDALALLATDKTKAAEALVAGKDDVAFLPAAYRRSRAARILTDAAPKASRQGSLAKQFPDKSAAAAAYACLSLAEKLTPEGGTGLNSKQMIDLILAAANQDVLADGQRAKLAERAEKLISDPKLFDDEPKALYPLTIACANLSNKPATVVAILAELAKRARGADRGVDVQEFSQEVLMRGIKVGLKYPEQVAKKDVARLMGELGDLILADRRRPQKLVEWSKQLEKSDKSAALPEAHQLFKQACQDDPTQVEYHMGKVKSRLELPLDSGQTPEALCRLLESWAKDAPKGEVKGTWLAGWTKLQTARFVSDDDVRLSLLGEIKQDLQTALTGAEKANLVDDFQLIKIRLDLSQTELELGNFYSQLPYEGYRQRLKSNENKKKHFNSAAEHAVKAKEIADRGKGQGLPLDVRLAIQDALGNAYEALAQYANTIPKENFAAAIKAFDDALALDGAHVAALVGKGRVLCNEGASLYGEDKAMAMQKLADAEKTLAGAVRAIGGNSLAAAEPMWFLGIAAYWKNDAAGELKRYHDIIGLYKQLQGQPVYATAAHAHAQGYVREALKAAFAREKDRGGEYARLLQRIDASESAKMFKMFGLTRLKGTKPDQRDGLKEIIDILERLIGNDHDAMASELVLAKWRLYDRRYYLDSARRDLVVGDKADRARLHALFERNAAVAPNDYVRVWSLLFSGEAGYFGDAAEMTKAYQDYRAGLKLAEKLIAWHGGIGNLMTDRPGLPTGKKGLQLTYFDDWNMLDTYYLGAANLAYMLAEREKNAQVRASYLTEALESVAQAEKYAIDTDPERRKVLAELKAKIERAQSGN